MGSVRDTLDLGSRWVVQEVLDSAVDDLSMTRWRWRRPSSLGVATLVGLLVFSWLSMLDGPVEKRGGGVVVVCDGGAALAVVG